MHATDTLHVNFIFPGNIKPKCRACGVANIFCLLGGNNHFYCKTHCIKNYDPIYNDMKIRILPSEDHTTEQHIFCQNYRW